MSMTVIVTGIPRKDSASPFVVLATVFGLPGIRLWLRRGEHGGESVQRLVHLVRRHIGAQHLPRVVRRGRRER